jgi:hypothetical protein
MQRVNKRRNRIYQEKEFEIQSLESLVRKAKIKTNERIQRSHSSAVPSTVHLPLQELNERLTDSLQQMHHHLQSLLMQKLGPDGRNVIAAERARQTRSENDKLAATAREGEDKVENPKEGENMATTLGELGQDAGDELELLNDYRVRYASILAELLVAKDRLLELEVGLTKRTSDPALVRRLSKDIEILSDDEDEVNKMRRRAIRRKSSIGGSSGTTSDRDDEDAVKGRGRKARRKSSAGTSSGRVSPKDQEPRGEENGSKV